MEPPEAAPPGMTRLKALPVSWVVAARNQLFSFSISLSRPQAQAKLASSSAPIRTNQNQAIARSPGA